MGSNHAVVSSGGSVRREIEQRLKQAGVPDYNRNLPRLRVRDDPDFLPVEVDRDAGILVSLSGAELAWRWLGLPRRDYALLLTLIGHARWTVLVRNRDIIAEDLIYAEEHAFCVFGPFSHSHEYVRALETPCVCDSCAHFFEELGAKREITALRRLIGAFSLPAG